MKMSTPDARITFLATVLAMLCTANAVADTDAVEADQTRQSVTSQSSRAARDRGETGTITSDIFPQLATQHQGKASGREASQSKLSTAAGQAPNTDFWFYAADVLLFNDNDGDGYFHGIDLLFDADTYYDFAEVYAVVYLSLEGGPWNEYASTENFTISGASADDEYVIVTELVAGYPSGSYDLLIELFDTFDGSFVASYGPDDTSELAFLQLEDTDRDVPLGTTTVIITERGGGSLGWETLLLLLACVLPALRRHSPGSSAGWGSAAA